MSDMLEELKQSIHQVMDDQPNGVGEALLWPQLVELGWLLVGVDEEVGGLGEGLSGACIVVQEIARRAAAVPIIPALLAIDTLSQHALADASVLENLMAGELATMSLATSSSIRIAENTMNGTLRAVQSADAATFILGWDEAAKTLFFIPLTAEGISIAETPMWDSTRRLFDVTFKNVGIENHQMIADPLVVNAVIAKREFLIAADCVGASEGIFAMTLEHLKVREQFSRPLAMFQALKHRCADIKSQIFAAEALLMDKLATAENSMHAAAIAKQFTSTVFMWVAEEGLQLHGGVGMAAEHNCHLFLKRAALNQQIGKNQRDISDIICAPYMDV